MDALPPAARGAGSYRSTQRGAEALSGGGPKYRSCPRTTQSKPFYSAR